MLYCIGYFEFPALFWGGKGKMRSRQLLEGKPSTDDNCAMYKIFNSTV